MSFNKTKFSVFFVSNKSKVTINTVIPDCDDIDEICIVLSIVVIRRVNGWLVCFLIFSCRKVFFFRSSNFI